MAVAMAAMMAAPLVHYLADTMVVAMAETMAASWVCNLAGTMVALPAEMMAVLTAVPLVHYWAV